MKKPTARGALVGLQKHTPAKGTRTMPDDNRSQPARSQAHGRSLQELQELFAGVSPDTDAFDVIWAALPPEDQARVPRPPRILVVPEGEIQWKIGRKIGAGRPRRDKAKDAIWHDMLLAALQSAPPDQLRGESERLTKDACERYLERKFRDIPREIIRKAVKTFSQTLISGD
jgi:hypothetical protein